MAIDVSNASSGRFLSNGTPTAPNLITAADGVAVSNVGRELQFIAGDAAAVIVTANPRVGRGTVVGQELLIVGASDTNTVTLQNGNGLALNGAAVLGAGASLLLMWDGAAWNETGRNDL
jgi:hypothetical protein